MRGESETDGVPIDLAPDRATRLACTPFEKDHRVELVKIASSF